MTEQTTTTETTPAHCCVAHPDAGGPCAKPFAIEVYGLNFCEAHGEEARLGAALEAAYDVENYFRRQTNPEVIALSPAVLGALEAAIANVRAGQPAEEEYDRALLAAYSSAPEDVRERIALWERDEEHGYMSVIDVLLSSLQIAHKLQRIAYEDGETWLVEILSASGRAKRHKLPSPWRTRSGALRRSASGQLQGSQPPPRPGRGPSGLRRFRVLAGVSGEISMLELYLE